MLRTQTSFAVDIPQRRSSADSRESVPKISTPKKSSHSTEPVYIPGEYDFSVSPQTASTLHYFATSSANTATRNQQTTSDDALLRFKPLQRCLFGPTSNVSPHSSVSTSASLSTTSINAKAQPHQLVVLVQRVLCSGGRSSRAEGGTGGTYILSHSTGTPIGVFKPVDEEPYSPSNPNGFALQFPSPSTSPPPSQFPHLTSPLSYSPNEDRRIKSPSNSPDASLRRKSESNLQCNKNQKDVVIDDVDDICRKHGFLPGESAFREYAAYLIDHHGFAGVPPTALIRIASAALESNGRTTPTLRCPSAVAGLVGRPTLTNSGGISHGTKTGSFQEWVQHDCASWDLGPARFSRKQVHRIGLFDIRVLNCDRHGGNLLSTKTGGCKYRLTPIDHGYIFPSSIDEAWFEWLLWPQAKLPFDEETIAYVAEAIDYDRDVQLLETHLPSGALRPACLRAFRVSTLLVKKGVALGLTLYQLGSIACRMKVSEEPCLMEKMCIEAYIRCLLADPAGDEGELLSQSSENDEVDVLTRELEQCSGYILEDEFWLRISNNFQRFFDELDAIMNDALLKVLEQGLPGISLPSLKRAASTSSVASSSRPFKTCASVSSSCSVPDLSISRTSLSSSVPDLSISRTPLSNDIVISAETAISALSIDSISNLDWDLTHDDS